MDALATFLQQSITFFAILDPIGISAIALSILSPNITKTQINKVAYKATITIIIAFFAFDLWLYNCGCGKIGHLFCRTN